MASLCLDREIPRLIPAPASAPAHAATPSLEPGDETCPRVERSTPMTGEGRSGFGLRKITLLAGLEHHEFDELAARCAWRTYRAGQTVISRESRDRDVYLVVAGTVRATTYA